ncbi:hypothetical protein HXX01_01200 [Candidatus Nomurabacteria bacterium]|nr:hypothetical protein [Candidatus Nomurabacteria bacterium]
MIEKALFKGCEITAKGLLALRESRSQVVKKLDTSISLRVKILQRRVRTNLLVQCSDREKQFLDLNMTNGKKLLDYLVDQFYVIKSKSGQYRFMINALQVIFTDTEINKIFYDSGRGEIRNIAQSIFSEKLGVEITSSFDYKDKFVFAIWSMTDTICTSFN